MVVSRFSVVGLLACLGNAYPLANDTTVEFVADLEALLSTEEVGGSDQPIPTATPKSAVGEQGWRGIESAPMDGRSVLVFCPRASDHGYERIRLTWRKDGKWQGANNTSWPPTHWMPLPAAPQPKELSA